MTTVADIRAIVEEAYPPHLAESWDKVGLICGDPADQVHLSGENRYGDDTQELGVA